MKNEKLDFSLDSRICISPVYFVSAATMSYNAVDEGLGSNFHATLHSQRKLHNL